MTNITSITKEDIYEWARDEYGTSPEYLWAAYPEFGVLRAPNGKWYGIVMNVPAGGELRTGHIESHRANANAFALLMHIFTFDVKSV